MEKMGQLVNSLKGKSFISKVDKNNFIGNNGVRFEKELEKILNIPANRCSHLEGGDFTLDGVELQAKLQNGSLANPKGYKHQSLCNRIKNDKADIFFIGIKHRKDLIVYMIEKDDFLELAEKEELRLFAKKLIYNKNFGYRMRFTLNDKKGHATRIASSGSFILGDFHA